MQKMFNIARKLLSEQLNISVEQITAEISFSELNADSLDLIEVVMALEDIYDLEFVKDDLEYYPNLEALVTYLYEYLAQVRK